MRHFAELLGQVDTLGYACAERVFAESDLARVFDEYGVLVDRLANDWFADGLLASTYAQIPFEERFLQITREAGCRWSQHFDISLPLDGITTDTPIQLGDAVFNLIRHPRLLDLVEGYMGGEIMSTPIQHIRIKPPEDELRSSQRDGLTVTSPWHQDQGVALPVADGVRVLTVWIALTDASEQNGCLCVVPGSHRSGLLDHCPNGGQLGNALEIPVALRTEAPITLPVPRGSVIFLHHLTMHASLPNRSSGVRWSLDLRYQPLGTPSGRPMFPGFVARSRLNPASELTDPNEWRAAWHAAREQLAAKTTPTFHRWTMHNTVCA